MRTTWAPIPAEPPRYVWGDVIQVADRIRTHHGPDGAIECIRWNGWVDGADGSAGEWWIHTHEQSARCIRPFEIAEKL